MESGNHLSNDKIRESQRLNEMRLYLSLDFNWDKNLKDIVILAAQIFETPVAFVTLMDQDVQWIISSYGLDVKQMPRDTSFCNHTIRAGGVTIVKDALEDSRYAEVPVVKYDPHVRFYAGIPITSGEGHNIGTLCVLDVEPKEPTEAQLICLKALTNQVKNLMGLKLAMHLVEQGMTKIEQQNEALKKIAFIQSHELRGPLSSILALVNLSRYENYPPGETYISLIETAALNLDRKIHDVVGLTYNPELPDVVAGQRSR